MSPKVVYKLTPNVVEKLHNRYQAKLEKEVTEGLIKDVLQFATRALSKAFPIDDVEALASDLENDNLVKREIANLVGKATVRGGRMVALASAFFRVAKHVVNGYVSSSEAQLEQPKETCLPHERNDDRGRTDH